jgi:hypothetical protein
MKLDRGLSPLLLAAYVRVRNAEEDLRLRDIMFELLQRGANITQQAEGSGATVLHLLAYQPLQYCVMHRVHFLLNILHEYMHGFGVAAPLPGLTFDPVLNGEPPAGKRGEYFRISVHLLGMRCSHGMLPEDLAPAGARRQLLYQRRMQLPPALQGALKQDEEEVEEQFL